MNRRAWIAGAAALALGVAGCGPKKDSKVARGDLVEVGEPTYDALFQELHQTLARTEELDGEGPLRKAVAAALGLPEDTDAAETISVLSVRSKELKDKGVPISVALSPEPKIGGKAEWAEAIEKVLKEGLKRADELAALSSAIEKLEPRRAEALDQADLKLRPAGVPIAKIREVKAELEAAREVLSERQLLASNESGRSARYTLSVARAVDLTAGSAAAPPPPPTPEPKKLPPWAGKRPAGGTGKPPAGAPPKPPPPPKKPKGDDFEP